MKATRIRSTLASMLIAASASAALPGFAQTAMTDAEVRKVDKDNQKITLKHGEIKNLDMPPMTMVFAVKSPAMLDHVKTGDQVQFRAADENGKLTVTEIQAAK